MARQLRVALVSCGNRARMFGEFCRRHADLAKIVAVAEPRDEWREEERQRNNLPPVRAYRSYEQMLAPGGPEAELAIVASDDRTHYGAARMAVERGMNVLLEKPVAHDPVLTVHLALLARKHKVRVAVQHELRYSPFFQQVLEIVRSSRLGQVYSYTHTEHVEFWHMTHSFVRGNWSNSDEQNPMILAKCCHDLDLMPWILGDEVTRVASFGRLDHFTPANRPPGAPARCTDGCPVRATCIHDAEAFYMGPRTDWPVAMMGPGFYRNATPEERRRRLVASRYSRCVYDGRNNVVDHQSVMMETRRGTICTLTMQGFSAGEECGRKIRLDGTLGTLRGDMGRGEIAVWRHWHGPFGTKVAPEIIDLKKAGLGGHGGGDERLFEHVLRVFAGAEEPGEEPLTTIDNSVESHLLAWAAEESRLKGRVVDMDAYRKRIAARAKKLMSRKRSARTKRLR